MTAADSNRRLALAQPAVRAGQKGRIALVGPSGAGKTWTALTIAGVLAGDGRVLLIDTEEGSGALYADDFKYDHLRWLPPYDPRELTKTMGAAGIDYAVVIVDSLSHFWDDEGGTLDIVDSVAARSSSKNSFAAWKEGTPIQKDMVRSFLRCSAHVIVTMRAKTEYVLEQDERTGRTSPRRIGLAPVQRAGLEYEFTLIGNLELNHQLVIDKSRCPLVADKRYLAGKASLFAKTFADWLGTAQPEPVAEINRAETVQQALGQIDQTSGDSVQKAQEGTQGAAPRNPGDAEAKTNGSAEPASSEPSEDALQDLFALARSLDKPATNLIVKNRVAQHGLDSVRKELIQAHARDHGIACEHVAQLAGLT